MMKLSRSQGFQMRGTNREELLAIRVLVVALVQAFLDLVQALVDLVGPEAQAHRAKHSDKAVVVGAAMHLAVCCFPARLALTEAA